MNKILEIFLGIVFILHQIPEGNSKEFYQLNINERGTPFNETIEVDNVEKTVVYKVPSHNEIKKTDVLVDYKNGHFVTRIPERGACYIKAFSTADEQSLGETRQNLKLIQRIKSRGNVTVPVETVNIIMKLIREIPREELSPKILDFCGDNSAYLVKEEVMPRKKGKSIIKRSSDPETRTYSVRFRTSVSADGVKKNLPNGYLTCKTLEKHNEAIASCLPRKTPMVGCGLYPVLCRYQATCELLPAGMKKINTQIGGMNTRDLDGLGFINVDIKCVEVHKFTSSWCCDVIPCTD